MLFKIRRREALKTLATAAGGTAVAARVAEAAPAPMPGPKVRGFLDPDFQNPVVPWHKVLTKEELRTVAAVVDLILPADERSPAASKLGVPGFIDEWIGAPYPVQQADNQIVRGGLGWLNTESWKRFGRGFADLQVAQQHQIARDIADVRTAKARFKTGAVFFATMRSLALAGYYTTPEGMKEIGYVGNVPLPTWDGPPPEILKRLKLA